jgi:hypothetical protein
MNNQDGKYLLSVPKDLSTGLMKAVNNLLHYYYDEADQDNGFDIEKLDLLIWKINSEKKLHDAVKNGIIK